MPDQVDLPSDEQLPEDLADEEVIKQEQEDEPTWRRWLPWIALALIILLVAWLIWMFSDLGDGKKETTVTRTAIVVVPDVVGMTEEDARVALVALGLNVRTEVSYDIVAPPGTVSDQSITAGTKVEKGSKIAISVVPDEARTITGQREKEREAQEVNGSSPPPGQLPAPRMLPVPKVLDMSEASARSAIEKAGFEPRVMYQPISDHIGKVFQQSPDAGVKVPEGRYVYILVGSMN